MSLKSLWGSVLKVTIITNIIVCQGFTLNNEPDSDYLSPITRNHVSPTFKDIRNVIQNSSNDLMNAEAADDETRYNTFKDIRNVIQNSTDDPMNAGATDELFITPLELDLTTKLAVTAIINGKISEAVYHMDKLFKIISVTHQKLPSIVSTIVKLAYNYNHRFYHDYRVNNPVDRVDPDNRVANIVEFIRDQPFVSEIVAGFDALFTEMKANNHLNSLRVLILGYALNQSSVDPAELSPLKDKIKSYENNMIDLFADDYRFNKRNPDFSHFQLLNNGDYFLHYLKEIINRALNKTKPETINRLKHIIYSIHNFAYFGQTAEGLSVVCDYIISEELQETPVTIKLAYMVNYYMTRPNYQRLSYELKNQFQSINEKLPKDVVDFISKPNSCKLINKEHGEYLYADDAYDEARRHAYLWREPQNDMVLGSKWKFETPNMGDTFTIKNVHYSEDLYAAADLFAYDGSRRSVFTWIPGTAGDPEEQWEIVPRNDAFFTLKNGLREEYLYGDSEIVKDKDRRYVFTWRNGTLDADKLQESLWEIKCH